MSKDTHEHNDIDDDIYDNEISDDDYGFIIGPNGELKSVFLPDRLPEDLPDSVLDILDLFGIDDIDSLGKDVTIH